MPCYILILIIHLLLIYPWSLFPLFLPGLIYYALQTFWYLLLYEIKFSLLAVTTLYYLTNITIYSNTTQWGSRDYRYYFIAVCMIYLPHLGDLFR